jgi:hypothetical protein
MKTTRTLQNCTSQKLFSSMHLVYASTNMLELYKDLSGASVPTAKLAGLPLQEGGQEGAQEEF